MTKHDIGQLAFKILGVYLVLVVLFSFVSALCALHGLFSKGLSILGYEAIYYTGGSAPHGEDVFSAFNTRVIPVIRFLIVAIACFYCLARSGKLSRWVFGPEAKAGPICIAKVRDYQAAAIMVLGFYFLVDGLSYLPGTLLFVAEQDASLDLLLHPTIWDAAMPIILGLLMVSKGRRIAATWNRAFGRDETLDKAPQASDETLATE